MEIKGTAVKSINDFVKDKYPSEYASWVKSLPPESLKIMTNVRSNDWYPLKEAAIIPSELVGELFFNNDKEKGAMELGRYSAEKALQGIYKIYVKFSSPNHIISRAQRIISAYYSPTTLEIQNNLQKSVQVVITKFEESHSVIENRFVGWYLSALEISGCKNVQVNILTSMAKGDKTTTFECKWE